MSRSRRYEEFHAACWDDHAKAERLLAADPSLLDVRSGLDETVLHDSAIENGLKAVQFLLSHGADPDPRDHTNNSPLQDCAFICNGGWDLTPIIALLLEHGADPYHFTEFMPCAWHIATNSGNAKLRGLFAGLAPPAAAHPDCDWDFGGATTDPTDSH